MLASYTGISMFFSSPGCVCLLNSNLLKNKSEINGRRPGPDNGVFVTEKCKKEYMSISRMSKVHVQSSLIIHVRLAF